MKTPKEKTPPLLEVHQCSNCKGKMTLSLYYGDDTGLRVGGSKCCTGQYGKRIGYWLLTYADVPAIMKEYRRLKRQEARQKAKDAPCK